MHVEADHFSSIQNVLIMPYNLIFLDMDRPPEVMWFHRPKVGDIVKINMLTDEELEYWTIVEVEGITVKVKQ